jgi:dTDP-4-dehydrorhamnose reductase
MLQRILITGGSSYLGQHLLPLAQRHYNVSSTYFSHKPSHLTGDWQKLDLRDSKAVINHVKAWQPEVIIHLAGSDRSEDMSAVICRGAENIVRAAQEVNARLIHLSSDVIFDGRTGPYSENEPPSPIHAYGQAKAAAESIVGGHSNHVIIRTSLIYSLTKMDYSTKWMVSALNAGKPITLFIDQIRNPVWTTTLAQSCLELVEMNYQGKLNIAGEQELSRAEFGLRMLDYWNIQDRPNLSTGPSPETWPKDCRLDISLAKRLLPTPMPGVDAVINAYKSS